MEILPPLAPSKEDHRVLVVGGGGVFGSLLVEALIETTDWTLVVVGRTRPDTTRWPTHRVEAMVLDAQACTPDALRATRAWIVINASGPFQGRTPVLAEAAIQAGCHYLDLCDDRHTLIQVPAQLDAAAQGARVAVVLGLSLSPALSSAVVQDLTAGWTRIDQIMIALYPGHTSPRGPAVVQSLLTCVGQPIQVWKDGAWTSRFGWGLTQWARMPVLGGRFLSLCDAADLELFPARWRVRRTVMFQVGFQMTWLHLALVAASRTVRWRILTSLQPLARMVRRGMRGTRHMGSARGGLKIEVHGRDATGQDTLARWSLVADHGDGPVIPILPVLALLRTPLLPGARTGMGAVSLHDIEAEMSRYRITVQRAVQRSGPSVLAQALGRGMRRLPEELRAFHTPGFWADCTATVQIDAPASWSSRMVRRLNRWPAPTDAGVARVTQSSQAGVETWTLGLDGRVRGMQLRSPAGQVEARIGPWTLDMAARATGTGLELSAIGGRLWGIRLPKAWVPCVLVQEALRPTGEIQIDLSVGRFGRMLRARMVLRP